VEAGVAADKAREGQGEPTEAPEEKAGKSGGKRKLLLLALPLLLAVGGAGLWFTGTLPHLLGMDKKPAATTLTVTPPVFVAIPEMVANLDAGPDRQSFVKLGAKLEVPGPDDAKRAEEAMPRIVDLFQTYLREMRPEDFQGSEGTWRLREALLSRAAIALAPGHVRDLLFTEILVQ
jgi:flagellar FliL protein